MDYFEKNLECLQRFHGSSFAQIGEFCTDDGYEVVPSPSGFPVLLHQSKALHSRFDPVKEAFSFVNALELTRDGLIIFGLGLGYHLEALVSRFPDKKIIAVESSLQAFCLLLAHRNFLTLIENKRISFLIHPESSDISALAGNLLDYHIVKISSLCAPDAEYFQNLEASLDKSYKREQINENTLIRFSNIWVRNFFRNLSVLRRASRIEELKGTFTGIPALLLAAGPSLDLVRSSLKPLSKTHLIVAVDTASTLLREEGIEPDFLVVVDPQYWNCRHLDRCQTQSSILVSESSTYPSVFRNTFKEVCFCSSVFPVGKLWEEGTGNYGRLAAGGSVSTTALDLLVHLGVSEINVIGLDLGFPSKMTHYKAAFFEHRALIQTKRLAPAETESVKALYDANPFFTDSNNGSMVLTDERLIVYKWWFESYLTAHKTLHFWNLSPHGVRIEGLSPRDWQELLGMPTFRTKIEAIKKTLKFSPAQPTANHTFSSTLIDQLTRLKRLASQGLHLLELNKNNLKKLEQLDWIDAEILKAGSRDIAGFILTDLVKDLRKEQTEPSLCSHLERMESLYKRIAQACDYHINLTQVFAIEDRS